MHTTLTDTDLIIAADRIARYRRLRGYYIEHAAKCDNAFDNGMTCQTIAKHAKRRDEAAGAAWRQARRIHSRYGITAGQIDAVDCRLGLLDWRMSSLGHLSWWR